MVNPTDEETEKNKVYLVFFSLYKMKDEGIKMFVFYIALIFKAFVEASQIH